MASAKDNATSTGLGARTDAGAQTRQNVTAISTGTASMTVHDSTSQIDRKVHDTMAQAKPATDTAMASAVPIMEEASTHVDVESGKDYGTQVGVKRPVLDDIGVVTESTSVKTASNMTSPTRKTNAGSQFQTTTNTSSTMTASKTQDGGTSPDVKTSSTRQTQYESISVNRSMNTRD